MKINSWLVLFTIVFLGAFIRLYQLGSIPNGLEQDETSIGYNAYSILKTGKDEYGKQFPVIFKAFGEYKLPGYIYLATIPIAILGPTATAVRLPSAIFGTLTILITYFLVLELFQRKNDKHFLAFLTALFVAINPWHVHFSRGAFEVTPALFFLTTGVLIFLFSIRTNRSWTLMISAFSFIAAMYTYNITRALAPFIGVFLICWFWATLKKINLYSLTTIALLSILFLIPFVLSTVGAGGVATTKGTFIFTSFAVRAPITEFRAYMVGVPSLLNKFLFNTFTLTFWEFIYHVVSYFSVSFLFLTGSTHGNHGIGTTGQFYIYELFFITSGLVFLIKSKDKNTSLLFFWIITTIIIASLTREAPQATRSFFIIIPLEIISAYGCLSLFTLYKKKQTIINKTILTITIFFVCYSIANYFFSYTQRFPIYYAKSWRSADKDLSLYLQKNEKNYSKIIIDPQAGYMYTSFLYDTGFSPSEFQSTSKRAPDDSEGFSTVLSFGNYELRQIDWAKDYEKKDVLFVTTNDNKPKNIPVLATFYYPKRPIVLSVKEQLIQYPVEEIAYVVVRSANYR